MRTDEGHVLVDWDTVALGPRERDLWWLADEPDDLAAYTALSGHEVDPDAVAFFRLAWDLNDVAQYLSVLRSTPRRERGHTRRLRGRDPVHAEPRAVAGLTTG